jgi:hypothetical protein
MSVDGDGKFKIEEQEENINNPPAEEEHVDEKKDITAMSFE